jgi:hypothetical protein
MVPSHKLIEATPYLVQNWLPFNEPLLERLKKTLHDSKNAPLNDKIVASVRSDPSLYTYCLLLGKKEALSDTAKAISVSEQVVTGLRKLCNNNDLTPRLHRLNSASKRQQELLRNCLTRTTASTVLAPYFNVDCDSAYTSNSLREIGLALIAWNYPRIFTQVEEQAKNVSTPLVDYSATVDERLKEMLGFNPLNLALSLGQSFDLPAEILLSMEDPGTDLHTSEETLIIASTLRKVSEISQIFAQASSPQASEVIITQWDLQRKELLPKLGASGLTKLRESCITVINSFSDILPEINSDPIPERLCLTPKKDKTQRYLQNIHITHCNQETQELLQQLYSKINPAIIAYANVTRLITEIAPVAGFESGAIYLINPGVYSLEPRLVLGTAKEKFIPVYYRQQENRQNLVAMAFTGKLPVIESFEDGQLRAIAGILGDMQRVGVLYLIPKLIGENTRSPSLRAHFKALQQTLNDCLNLS